MKQPAGKVLFISITLLMIYSLPGNGQETKKMNVKFVDYFFENASPVNWYMQGDTAMRIWVMYDYERESINRQATHWHFKLEADPGTIVKLIFSNLDNIWNGRPGSDNPKPGVACFLSYDKINWEGILTTRLPGPKAEFYVEFIMKGSEVYIARMPPYTITDLENFKARISGNPLVKITNIGKTVEKRPLEIIQVGNQNALHSVIIRVRAHSWETGGNWAVEGLINKYLSVSAGSKKWVDNFCFYIMPMAHKDGVARGMTRFNLKGKDLNRDWNQEPDSVLCPEKYAFEKFIAELIRKGRRPDFGIDFHNDSNGSISFGTHDKNDTVFMKNMQLFEKLMRKYTSFSEGVTGKWDTGSETGPLMSFSDAMIKKYGFEAIVYELNSNWIRGLKKIPLKDDYMKVGENLNQVFYEYFNNEIRP
jgi:hypothetical protein